MAGIRWSLSGLLTEIITRSHQGNSVRLYGFMELIPTHSPRTCPLPPPASTPAEASQPASRSIILPANFIHTKTLSISHLARYSSSQLSSHSNSQPFPQQTSQPYIQPVSQPFTPSATYSAIHTVSQPLFLSPTQPEHSQPVTPFPTSAIHTSSQALRHSVCNLYSAIRTAN